MLLRISNYFFVTGVEDRTIIRNLSKAFEDNVRIRTMVQPCYPNVLKGIKVIIAYCYFMVKKLGGIYVTKSKSTFMLYSKQSEQYIAIRDVLHCIYVAIWVVGLHRIFKLCRRQRIINTIRADNLKVHGCKDYYYVWFLAQKKEVKHIKGLLEARAHIFDKAKHEGVPVYMETTVPRLVPLYERLGFDFYTSCPDPLTGITIWFARRA